MKLLFFLCLIYYSQIVKGDLRPKNLVCFFDAMNTDKQGHPHHFEILFLKALPNCTHLVYSFAQIQPQTYEISKFTVYPQPRELKTKFPHLKVFLSLGGDKPDSTQQYLQFLEAGEVKQQHFIENAKVFLKLNYFDGLDLAFPFPRNKPRKVHSGFGAVVKRFKKMFTGDESVDPNAEQHAEQYTNFVHNLKNEFLKANLKLSMTVLPNVNSTWYFNIFKIHKNFDFINLFAFDFLTPNRNPEEADYTAPIYHKEGAKRLPHYNIEYQVNHWINNGCPVNKLNLGIATYGRAWKLTTDSGLSGLPVVESTDGAADQGKFTKTPGLLSWPEICTKLDTKFVLKKVVDKEGKYGNYAFSPADKKGGNGIWISFDDPEFAGVKTEYVKQKGLGGVAVYNLHNDDYQKFCRGPVFPILSRISQDLGIFHPAYKQRVKSDTFSMLGNLMFPQKSKYNITKIRLF